jgi:hypothetical protein
MRNDACVIDTEGEQAQVAQAQPARNDDSKASWKRVKGLRLARFLLHFGFVVLLQQIARHGGNHRAGKQVAGKHGEDHSFRHAAQTGTAPRR